LFLGANEFAKLGRSVSRECGGVRESRRLFDEYEKSTHVVPASEPGPQRERNCARRGGADSRFGSIADAFYYNWRQGLWVRLRGDDGGRRSIVIIPISPI
jgi:hypothetical protein